MNLEQHAEFDDRAGGARCGEPVANIDGMSLVESSDIVVTSQTCQPQANPDSKAGLRS